jgi:hypothetical protein
MPRRSPNRAHSNVEYQAIKDEDDNPRASINSVSPILPKLDGEFERVLDNRDDFKTFDTEGVESYYKPIEGYEGAHRYDPKYRWNKSEEKEIVWKVRVPSLQSSDNRKLMLP